MQKKRLFYKPPLFIFLLFSSIVFATITVETSKNFSRKTYRQKNFPTKDLFFQNIRYDFARFRKLLFHFRSKF